MLSTGDVQNYLRKLQTELRFIKFRDVDYKSLQTGNPCEFLKIYHYLFLDYSPLFAKSLLDKYNFDFYGKTDSHFMDTLYKTLRDHFNYKPPITKEQFFTTGFAERKLQMACDVIGYVRSDAKEIQLIQQQQKRTGSASARLTNGEKEKKRISSAAVPSSLPNVFPPLRDMSLVPDQENDHYENQYKPAPRPVSIDKRSNHNSNQKRVENWLDEAEFEPDHNHRTLSEFQEPITALTITRLEEQIQELKIRIEDINARLENVTSIVNETHSGQNSLTSADLSNFNARLVIVENELALFKRKVPVGNTEAPRLNSMEPKGKQPFVPQGILIDSDEEENMVNSYAIAEPVNDYDVVVRARSLLENAEQCNRELLKTIQTKS